MKEDLNLMEELSLFKIFKFSISQAKPFFIGWIGFVLISFIWAIDLTLRPYLIKILVDSLASSSKENGGSIFVPIFCYLLMSIIIVIIFRLHDALRLWISPRMRQNIINHISYCILNKSQKYLEKNPSGDLASQIQQVSGGTFRILSLIVDEFFAHFLALFIIGYTLIIINSLIGFLFIIWILFFLIHTYFTTIKGQTLSLQVSKSISSLIGRIGDVFQNHLIIKIFSTEEREIRNISEWSESLIKIERKQGMFFLKMWTFQGFIFVLMQGLALVILVREYPSNVTIGDFVLILSLSVAALDSMGSLSEHFTELSRVVSYVYQSIDIIADKESLEFRLIQKPENHKDAIVIRPTIELKDICFSYSGKNQTLNNISLKIPPFQKVGIIGTSGSGKTTFIYLILRLLKATSGFILINEKDVNSIPLRLFRDCFSVITQEPLLFNRTVFENIAYSQNKPSLHMVIDASIKAHAHDFVLNLENGYDTIIGPKGSKLSGGQKQRIAIARAFLRNSPFLIMDEPTSALDLETEKLIQESLEELMIGKTVLTITHKFKILEKMDRILVFNKGKIIRDEQYKDTIKINKQFNNSFLH